jgi:hypothetical protein
MNAADDPVTPPSGAKSPGEIDRELPGTVERGFRLRWGKGCPILG